MYYSSHLRVLFLTATILFAGTTPVLAQNPQPRKDSQVNTTATVHLHWGARPGVSRYRLQLARDSEFGDIVFDRVVTRNDHQIDDLEPGKYFWRIAPLTTKLGEFSSAGAIEVSQSAARARAENPRTVTRTDDSAKAKPLPLNPIVASGGWRAAVGEITRPILAHLRSMDRFDLVGINGEGVTLALDSASGIALWRRAQTTNPVRSGAGVIPPLVIRSRSGLDNVVVLAGSVATQIDGVSGRELWRAELPAAASSGMVLSDQHTSEIIVVDNSLQRIFILGENDGNIIAQVRLPHRIVGAPVSFDDKGSARVVLAFDNGLVEMRDKAGAVVRSGDAGSPATTPPLFVKGTRGDLVLVGTRSGLTALNAEDLHALGRVAIKDDAPRGTLSAEDLDGDGIAEVIMLTDGGRVVAVKAGDGKILWEVSVGNDEETVAFADLNGDRVLDVVLAGRQSFAMALSGHDGSIVWKDNEPPALVANHAAPLTARSILAVPYGSGILLIGSDPSRTDLRAIEFPKGTARPRIR
jgi:outer membrane protein assembly factor BamB